MASPILAKVVRFIILSRDGIDSRKRLVDKQLLRRIVMIQVISSVYHLCKVRRIVSTSEKSTEIKRGLRNASSLTLVSTLYPFQQRLLSEKIPHKGILVWCSTIFSSLIMTSNLPPWLVSYVAVESLSERMFSNEWLKRFVAHLEGTTLVMIQQAIFCVIVPVLYAKSHKMPRATGAGKFLFSKRSFARDFLLFYSVWNFLSFYNYGKGLLVRSRKNKGDTPIQNVFYRPDEWSIRSSNMKPLMDKLTEIHEITFHNRRSLFEKFMNSSIVHNVVPCMKWALWRQVSYKTLTHIPRIQHRLAVNSKLMQSITMMLTFFVLDGRDSKMNIRPGVIRYFIRCILTSSISSLSQNTLKILLFALSQLAFLNHRPSSSVTT